MLRVVLSNPEGMDEVLASDFHDDRLAQAFSAIAPELASTPAGTPLDVSTVSDSELQGILRSLAMDTRPLPVWSEIQTRVQGRRLDNEIDEVEKKLATLESGTESHSDWLRRLIALQKEKRSLGES